MQHVHRLLLLLGAPFHVSEEIKTRSDSKAELKRYTNLLDSPVEAVVVVAAEPKPKADDAVVLAPNDPKEKPGAPYT